VPAIALARREELLDITRANDAGFDACVVHTSDHEPLLQCIRRLAQGDGSSTGGLAATRKISA
jgi:hypothetical protein